VVHTVPYLNSPAIPDQFGRADPYNAGLTGQWLLIVRNPNSSNSPVMVKTPSVGDAEIPAFIRGFSLEGAGSTPTFSWQLSDFAFDGQTLFISRRNPPPNGPPQIIHLANNARLGGATTYTVPDPFPEGGSLQSGERYWVSMNLNKDRPAGDPLFSRLLSRSRFIFEFFVQDNAPPGKIFLPFTAPDGTFRFDIAGVGPQTIFIDPPVAVGYDYAIGPGDPNFASVLLPDVGDGVYELHRWNGTAWVFDRLLTAGVPHSFPAGGVDRFRIKGIEASAGLDPTNPVAFVTGLTFTASGQFTGTMKPIPHPPATLVDHFHCYGTSASRGGLCTGDAMLNAGGVCKVEADCGGTTDVTSFCVPNRFPQGLRVSLADQFEPGPRVFDVTKPLNLCAPADKSGEGVHDADTHLQGYQIALTRGRCAEESPSRGGEGCSSEAECGGTQGATKFCVTQPRSQPALAHRVANQFHPAESPLVVDTIKPDRLLVPAAKSLTPGPDLPGPSEVDHYKCYTVGASRGTPRFTAIPGVLLVNQFTNGTQAFDLTKPTRLCVPVDKNGEGIKHAATSMLCYQAKRSRGVCTDSSTANAGHACTKEEDCGGARGQTNFCGLQSKFAKTSGVFVADQLDAGRVDLTKEDEFCVPSETSPSP
jgi:hypothetical protein